MTLTAARASPAHSVWWSRFDYVKEVYSSLYEKRARYSCEAFKAGMGRRMAKPVPAVLVATKCDMFDEEVCTFFTDVLDFAEQNNLMLIKVGQQRDRVCVCAHCARSCMEVDAARLGSWCV